ncbi:hypothetical protein ACFWP3_39270 [Streptomyces sp. NPDC058525]|uniref:hypothetical protein n=1 Tax=Streptomyces sp. NPDC058525 TaxID=3346538 RepID=UPI0036501F20
MTRTPDHATLASLDTHRLIVTLPNQGPADIRSNLPRATAAAVLRRLADELDADQRLPALKRAARPKLAAVTNSKPKDDLQLTTDSPGQFLDLAAQSIADSAVDRS